MHKISNTHRPLNYFERDADQAVEFMRQIGHERFSAVGWSDGGITGLVAASRHPAAVERLAVWGANAHVTDKDMEMLDKVSDVAQGWAHKSSSSCTRTGLFLCI